MRCGGDVQIHYTAAQTLGNQHGGMQTGAAYQQDKLLAPKAGGQVILPHRASQQGPELFQGTDTLTGLQVASF